MLDKYEKFINLFKRKQKRYKDVFDSPQGKAVLNDLMHQTGVNRVRLESNEETQFNNGKRAVGLYILNTLNRDVDSIIKQMEEEQKGEESYV